MVDGLWVDGFVRVVGTCGSICSKVFFTRGQRYRETALSPLDSVKEYALTDSLDNKNRGHNQRIPAF